MLAQFPRRCWRTGNTSRAWGFVARSRKATDLRLIYNRIYNNQVCCGFSASYFLFRSTKQAVVIYRHGVQLGLNLLISQLKERCRLHANIKHRLQIKWLEIRHRLFTVDSSFLLVSSTITIMHEAFFSLAVLYDCSVSFDHACKFHLDLARM